MNTVNNRLHQILTEYGHLHQELQPLLDRQKALKDAIKQGMADQQLDVIGNSYFKATYSHVKTTRLDQKKAIDLLTPKQRKECIKEYETDRLTLTPIKHEN